MVNQDGNDHHADEQNDMLIQMANLTGTNQYSDVRALQKLREIAESEDFIRMKRQMMEEYRDDLLDEAVFTFMLRPAEFDTEELDEDLSESSFTRVKQ